LALEERYACGHELLGERADVEDRVVRERRPRRDVGGSLAVDEPVAGSRPTDHDQEAGFLRVGLGEAAFALETVEAHHYPRPAAPRFRSDRRSASRRSRSTSS